MTELKPIDDDLAPEVAALAAALRDLFADLGVSVRRYAVRRSYDSGTVSRYLGGGRVPPWEFVLHLLHDVAERRGTVPTQETSDLLRNLHTSALECGRSPAHRAQLLERKLADADREAQRAATRERWLEDNLHDREQRLRDLQMRHRELQATSVPPPKDPLDDEPPGTVSDESIRLRGEIHALEEELARVRALHRRAEERCDQLERRLAEVEEAAGDEQGAVPTRLPDVVPARGPVEGVVHEGGAANSRVVGGNAIYNSGNLTMFTDTWQVDEEFVFSMSVRVTCDGKHLGNGLLVDATTVVTVSYVLQQITDGDGPPVVQLATGERVSATAIEVSAETSDESLYQGGPPLAVLRLDTPVTVADGPMVLDSRFTPGRQLLVSAYAANGRFSCLLDITGRTGDRLRVAGDIVNGLGGAPAFTSAGALAGIVVARWAEGRGGFLLPVAALGALESVTLRERE
ncbi:hypothetical protein [Streptomyces sp. NPDC058953]|uniref:hypothetical protein n=1 Tax=unclassified Streptomyces TaxID=2593676 RepID=UPI003681C985